MTEMMSRGPIIGRGPELEVLGTAIAEARAGRGGVVLLVGEPGIGKSRLVEEVARLAEDTDVAWGRAWEAGGAPAYWPWIQVLRTLGGSSTSPHVERLRGDATPAPPTTAEDRFFLFDAMARHLTAADRPRVILLEDLHAADESSLHLLAFLAGQLREAPVLVVGTYRDVEARLTPAAGAVLDRVARSARVVRPGRLSHDDVRELAGPLDPDLVAALYRRSEGNPLFVVELLRVVPARGGVAVPTSVRTAIRAHLAGLPPALRPVLDAAAVIGRELQAALVAEIVDRADVHDELARAIELGVLIERGPNRFAFAHGLLQEVLHDDLAAARRHELHAAVAARLERDPSPPLAGIAHHLLEAGAEHADRASRATLRAAERARRQLAFEPAAALIERALAGAPTTDPALRFELVRLLAEVRILGGDDARGKDTAREAAALARTAGSPELLARAALTAGLSYSFGHIDQTLVQLLEEALAALPAGDGALRARMLARLAGALTPAAVERIPLGIARDAVAMAGRLTDDRARLDVLFAAVSALIPFAPSAERRALNLEVLELARRFDDPLVELRSLNRLVFDHIELADLLGFEMYLRAYDEGIARHRLARVRWHLPMFRALLALLQGRFADHRAEVAEAERLAVEAGDPMWHTTRIGHSLHDAVTRHDVPLLARDRIPFSTFTGQQYPPLATVLYAFSGDVDTARALLAQQPIGAMCVDAQTPQFGIWIAELAWRFADRALATDVYGWLTEETRLLVAIHMHGFGVVSAVAAGAMYAAAALGDLEAARGHFASALRTYRSVGARPLEARLLHDYAAITSDPDEARAHAARAAELAAELGIALPASPGAAPAPSALALRGEGEVWVVEGLGATCRLRASRGIEMLARLVGEPGREIHALELMGAEGVDAGDAGELLDADAKRAYRTRVLALREELAEAEQWHDTGRAERARDELEALETELARATGLGGRDRRAGKAAERARSNVQRRLADAVKRIAEASPELGAHFAAALRTGAYCSYEPARASSGR